MTAPIPPGYPQPEPRTGPRWWERRWLQLTVAGLVIFIVGAAIGSAGNSGNSKNTAAAAAPTPDPATVSTTTTQTATATVTTTYTPVPQTAFAGDGVYLVGTDVQPGTYRSPGGDGGQCYADTETRSGNILDQEIGTGQIILVVTSSAYKITVHGCQDFTRA